MVNSMTGYGKAEQKFENKKITVELKSLNSKQLDLNLRMPLTYKALELDARNIVGKMLSRGKVDMNINVECTEVQNPANINAELFKHYFKELENILTACNQDIENTDYLRSILSMPEVIKQDQQTITEDEQNAILKTVEEACKHLNEFRATEGKALQADLQSHIDTIRSLSLQVPQYEQARITKIRERLEQNLSEIQNKVNIDPNRLEQELIYYIEKLDINEEKVRLAQHLKYFEETMETEEPGKKLGFIAQEIGREINTLGSKANDANLQKLVINMKDELEKIKEQVLNVL